MKIIIAGSRTITNVSDEAIEHMLKEVCPLNPVTAVICGMARGGDAVGRRWAKKNGIPVIEMPARWQSYGKQAGMIRNQQMVDIADGAIFLWDGASRGTMDCMRRCAVKGIPHHYQIFT